MTLTITPEQHQSLVTLLADLLDTADSEDFPTRREYLGYVAELSDLYEAVAVPD